MFSLRRAHALISTLLLAIPAALAAQTQQSSTTQLPLKHDPRPTAAAITPGDLMTRLYIFADDSMQGRQIGTVGHFKSTEYLARELQRLGIKPGGERGSYFQDYPYVHRRLDSTSTITVAGTTLKAGIDFIATSRGKSHAIAGAAVVFGGVQGDTANALSADQVNGKIVILKPGAGGGRGFGRGGGGGRGGFGGAAAALRGAVAVATIASDATLDPAAVRAALHPTQGFSPPPDSAAAVPLTLTITPRAAEALLSSSIDAATKGQAGKSVTGSLKFVDAKAPARNVIGIIRGSDPALRGEFVAIGAHSDHVGFGGRAADHDSLHLAAGPSYLIRSGLPDLPRADSAGRRAQLDAVRPQLQAIQVNLDSVRRLRPIRLDSIRNGADDDGSGSVTALEIAEAFARGATKPKRSLIFVWHTGEEAGLLGSRWFVDHPTVSRDSIVAQLNMDMVGRGSATDIAGGGDAYLQLVGSRRLSTELGDIVEDVNKSEKTPFGFDYSYDANGHSERIYCRSDHYNYARYGIPIVFFTTGLHGDYHQVTDEPQYIDYAHMARVGQLVHDIAVRVGNLDHRPLVDKPKPDPAGQCVQ